MKPAIVLAAALLAMPAFAQPLAINGEAIADAALMAAARKESKILYYGSYPESSFKIIADAFAKDTGINVTYMRLTTQNMFPRVTTEFTAGKLEADIVDMTDLTLVHDLVGLGVLARPHITPSHGRLAKSVRDEEGRWYAIVRPTSTITVNTAMVKEADYPKSYKDMLDPKWAGKLAMPGIDAGGSTFSMYMFLRDVVSPDYWPRLAALKPRIHAAIIPTTTDLIRGEASAIMGGPEPSLRQLEEGAPLKIIFPVEGLSSFPIAGGITTRGRNVNASRVFLNWITSKRGGDTVSTTGGYATHPDAPAPVSSGVRFPPTAQVWNIPLDEWLKKRETYSKEWRALFTGGR